LPDPDPGETAMFGWLEDAVHARPGPANVTVTVWALVTNDPAVPKLSEERLKDIVEDAPAAPCATGTLIGPMVKAPVRVCELELALTDHEAVLADTNTDAQFTLDVAASDGQEAGLGVMARFPDPPLEATFTAPGLIVYEQAAPVCVTAKFKPLILRLPVREPLPGLAVTA
jgi:hypothetical protein